jgi:hypothetical protein
LPGGLLQYFSAINIAKELGVPVTQLHRIPMVWRQAAAAKLDYDARKGQAPKDLGRA